ncbi:D-alanyl-D-alanine carboxypeptidase/D-alanyl-D-alanine endopeptidase [Legionella israelensis]|nr:D-alanyl-D-alanine carboxypeptidase/D-alanyl-D-alanine-endopeptidase [Legionella israelensis]
MPIKYTTMKIIFNIFTPFFIFFLSLSSHADASLPKEMLDVMSQPRYQNAQWWVVVKDLNNQKTLYQRNSNHLLMPASVTKLFSTTTALHILGDNYRFKTPVYFIGDRKNDILNGDIILVGKGDLEFGGRVHNGKLTYGFIDHIYANDLPGATITPEDPLAALTSLAEQIKARGIKKINGNVLIDDRLFDTAYIRNYTFSPVMINENLFDFQIKPGKPGKKASIKWRPKAPGYSIKNRLITIAQGGKTDIQISANDENTVFTIEGQIAANEKELLRIYPIVKPAVFARKAFIAALKNQGIEVYLNEKSRSLPDTDLYKQLPPIAEYISPPFSEYVKVILKLSHNIGADLIPFLLAAQHEKKTFAQGMPYIAEFLIKRVGLSQNTFVFGDGAGGDSNRLLPSAAINLLTYMYSRPKAQFKTFYAALPILGVDGSLKQAAKNIPAIGKVHAKTGTSITYDFANQRFYSFSEALSGYIEAKNGHLLAFIIAVSNTPMESIKDAFIIQKDVSSVASEIYNQSSSQ